MIKRKILIVSKPFYPMNSPRSFRTTELVKEFTRQGHNVTLVIPKKEEFHIPFAKEYGINIIDLKLKNYPVFKISPNDHKIITIFKRLFNRLLQVLFAYPDIELLFKVKKTLRRLNGFDLLITIATPHQIHWGVAWAWKNGNQMAKVWIADCGDPFMGSTLDSFKKMFYFKYFEKAWCKKVNFITVPFEGAKDGYYREFHNKIRVISQGFNFKDSRKNLSIYKENLIPTFAYAGGIIPARDPKYLIEYLLSLGIDFSFTFYTRQINYIQPFLKEANGKIKVKEYLPRQELLDELSRCDFIVNFENGISTQLPSKLIDYYLTGRPILSINTHDFNRDVVKKFLDKNYEERYKFVDVDLYKIENVCNEFLKLLNS